MNALATVSTVAAVAKVLAPSQPSPASAQTFVVRATDGRTFRVEGGTTPEEAIEAVARAQAFKRDSSPLGWGIGAVLTLLACVFGGRQVK